MANVVLQALLLFTAAFSGGAMNAVAGGGSFFSFPALLIVGLDAKVANATNTVALWPGSVASVRAYRRELEAQRAIVRLLAVVSLVGGLLGALLLLWTPSAVFRQLLPFLMLGATLLFAFSPRINRYIRSADVRRGSAGFTRNRTLVLQLIIAVYGGFFGGGLGILMLATLALIGMDHIHEMNAVKTLLAVLINGIAVVAFVFAGVVAWLPALVMVLGAIAGGYGGAALARRIQPSIVRIFVIIVGLSLSAYLFLG